MTATHPLLGNTDPDSFLRENWQREPLLIRQALPGFTSPLSQDELAGLALEPAIESRLIQTADWSVAHGPFTEETLTGLPDQGWSLLVQAADLWVDEVAELAGLVDFLPHWRRDDIMISLAPAGGSVGPHFDYYDVFLIQAQGRRQWQLGQRCDATTALRDDTPLRILDRFEPHTEIITEPGDVLYIPPGMAHHGIALDTAMTYSLGFRAPTVVDILAELAGELTDRNQDVPIADPPMASAMAGDEIDATYLQQVRSALQALVDNDELLADSLGRAVTRPRYPDFLSDTEESRVAVINGKRFINGDPA